MVARESLFLEVTKHRFFDPDLRIVLQLEQLDGDGGSGRLLKGPHADRVVRDAVRGMLPKNSLGRKLLSKLKVYSGPAHPHAAQQPEEFPLA